ncbi:endonuclease III domain-containing protein [Qipengyuania sp. 483]
MKKAAAISARLPSKSEASAAVNLLDLGPDPRTETLRVLQALLIQRFGRIERAAAEWRRPEWVLVQGVIGARTKSEVSNAATDRLLRRYGSFEAVAEAPLEELQAELATQTYPNVAAERLKASLSALVERRGAVDLSHLAKMDTLGAMQWLEQLPGIGRKIAAGVMNASTLDRRAIVLDSHHTRILQRMGLVPPKANTDKAFSAIMPVMPEEWSGADFDEHHLLMKKLGQTWCRPAVPQCAACPAQSFCKTGMARSG